VGAAVGGEDGDDDLELSGHGSATMGYGGGSVSSSGGGGGYYHHPYHHHHHQNGGGGSTPTGASTSTSNGNVLRGRLPAVLTSATQESFVNWLRLHTQLRQDASIRNALRAVNKFLRAVR
jgi:hypothetical protein